jgi:hypothetical protein
MLAQQILLKTCWLLLNSRGLAAMKNPSSEGFTARAPFTGGMPQIPGLPLAYIGLVVGQR